MSETILNEQLTTLFQQAPQDAETLQALAAIAPVLKAIASQFHHTQYYVLQTQGGSWLLTTLSNHKAPEIEKNVVYAYCSPTAANLERMQLDDPKLSVGEYGIVNLLFRLLGLDEVDSLILFDRPADTQNGAEIVRNDLRELCNKQMRQMKSSQIA